MIQVKHITRFKNWSLTQEGMTQLSGEYNAPRGDFKIGLDM